MEKMIPKTGNQKNQKLRDSAKDMRLIASGADCKIQMAIYFAWRTATGIADGKGRGIKSADNCGAILCARCHDYVDGRAGKASREEMQSYHFRASLNTRAWWKKVGLEW